MDPEITFKIAIFGPANVGKTTLTKRFLTGEFETNLMKTMGAEIFVKYLKIDDTRIVLQIWDFGGEDTFRFMLPHYATGSDGGIYMYDISRPETLNMLEKWLIAFKEGLIDENKDVPIMMIGGKLDLKDKNSVQRDEALKKFKQTNMFDFLECSSKTGENVDQVFENLVKKIMKDRDLIPASHQIS